ncbi:unnamed protein product, partial [Allacma fusca]
SSTEAEYIALASAAREAIWLRRFLNELGYHQDQPTTIFVDNQSTIKLAKNPELHSRTKHIDVRYHYTRTLVEGGEIHVEYTPTTSQKADGLTKALMKSKNEAMNQDLGLVELLNGSFGFNPNIKAKEEIQNTGNYKRVRKQTLPSLFMNTIIMIMIWL